MRVLMRRQSARTKDEPITDADPVPTVIPSTLTFAVFEGRGGSPLLERGGLSPG